jgi:hypothetical protein
MNKLRKKPKEPTVKELLHSQYLKLSLLIEHVDRLVKHVERLVREKEILLKERSATERTMERWLADKLKYPLE